MKSNKLTRAVVSVLCCGALALGGCASWDEPNDSSSSLREEAGKASDNGLPDPRSLTGVSTVAELGDVTPVDEDAKPSLPVELTDADGFDVSVTDTSRIVALDLYGTYTKTLAGLGLGDNIVGRAVSSTEPAMADVPVVTESGHSINVEAVSALDPTLIIVDHSVGPKDAINQLRDIGITTVVLEPSRKLADVGQDIEDLAGVVGLPDQGKKLAERSLTEIEENKKTIDTLLPEKPLRMAFLYARGNGGVFFILGPDSGTQDLIEGIGGIDVAAEAGITNMAPANPESLASLDPDVFVMMTNGLESAGGIDELINRPGVSQTSAGEKKRVIALPDGSSLAFGPQSGEVLLRAALATYNPDSLESEAQS